MLFIYEACYALLTNVQKSKVQIFCNGLITGLLKPPTEFLLSLTTGSLNWINLFKRVEMNPILCAIGTGKHTNYTSIPV